MQAIARLTRGYLCKGTQGISRLSQGYLCGGLTDVILPFKMCSVVLPSRGVLHLNAPAIARSTIGILCIPRTTTIIPPDFLPEFVVPDQAPGEDVLFNKTTNLADGQQKPNLAVPVLPILTSPALTFKISPDADIYNKVTKIVSNTTPSISKPDDADIYNKEDPDLINPNSEDN